MRRVWRRAQKKEDKTFKMNEQIKAPEVFLIDDEGVQVGKIATALALKMALDADLDLVEVNPKAVPPIVKILDYGQFKYEREKLKHKQKSQLKKIDTKVVRLSVRISSHDAEFRLNQARKFLEKGDKLKIELTLKGRERQHPEKASETINDFALELEKTENLNIIKEQDLTRQGGRFTIIFANKK
ncbi:translation initiation factor IF-3 [Patescibacteria group bacterium]|nr:translation initiation factor IF-3 [Patescibacteria group bacterium]